jgi:cellulase
MIVIMPDLGGRRIEYIRGGKTTFGNALSAPTSLARPSLLTRYSPFVNFKMRFFTAAVALLPALGSAHTIAQRVRVNGVDNGQGNGIRVATSNNPIQNVNDGNMACNANPSSSSKVIDVKAGDKVGVQWGHVVGGAQYVTFFSPFSSYTLSSYMAYSSPTRFANDKDHPIAPSHKGPTIFYMASVSNAASASPSGLKWFKVADDGLDQGAGTWGVDRMISNGGWVDFTLPSCVAPGQYLLRAEIIALHSASKQGQAQFYMVSGEPSFAGMCACRDVKGYEEDPG